MDESSRPPAIQPPGIFDDLRPGAILFGVVVDNVATFVASYFLVLLFAGRLAQQRGGDLPEEALDALWVSPEFLLASLVVGLLCTAFGAYVGARRAACAYVRHGAWIAVASAIVAVVFYALSGQAGSRPPLWFDLVGFTLMIPAGVAGGLLARHRSRERTVQPGPR